MHTYIACIDNALCLDFLFLYVYLKMSARKCEKSHALCHSLYRQRTQTREHPSCCQHIALYIWMSWHAGKYLSKTNTYMIYIYKYIFTFIFIIRWVFHSNTYVHILLFRRWYAKQQLVLDWSYIWCRYTENKHTKNRN